MTTQRKALKLAFEALRHSVPKDSKNAQEQLEAITAIKEVLSTKCVAQPAVAEQHKQEPTRWWTQSVIDKDEMDEHFRKRIDVYADQHPTLLVNQLARRLRQAWNTTPPQRKPLTDEEIAKIASTPAAVVGSYVHTFARAIEAAHGIKE